MMLDPSVGEFLTGARLGVVCTVRPDGRPRQSITYYVLDGDRILVSTESERGKARDVIRDGWASICVIGQQAPYPSVRQGLRGVLSPGRR
jgi:Pyridoxamine 5'-phosphate oxidase